MAHVVIHVAVSLDGATTGFQPDVGTFYSLARTWEEDVTLCGADTILAQDLSSAPQPGPNPDGARLVILDSRGRIDDVTLHTLRNAGHWRDAQRLSAARGRLREALDDLHAEGVIRVDSGGALNGALLAAGLVDEISLLVHPCLVDGQRWYGQATPRALEPLAAERLEDLVWLRYRVPPASDAPAA